MAATAADTNPSRSPVQDFTAWRACKQALAPPDAAAIRVCVAQPLALTPAERSAIRARLKAANACVIAGPVLDKPALLELGRQWGLTQPDANLYADEDAISSLHAAAGGRRGEYIPYTTQRLLWHTDGYYNPGQRRIRAFTLHCVRPALSGGVNQLLDPELAWLLLHEASPAYTAALEHPQAMTIPANVENGVELRPAISGPVFTWEGHRLHMRYTARTRSIEWRRDSATQEAVACLEGILSGSCPFILNHCLAAGETLLCNNVLHNRSAFQDHPGPAQQRLLFRARYQEPIAPC
jgi:hypothetical protein